MPKDFLGVPLVIEEMPAQEGDTPDVARIVPLSYAVMKTDAGTMKCVFYYESAPHTVDTFLTLSEQGFYDGLTFHRVVPDFVIQGGDPTGTGSGGPGFHIGAEFNNRPHIAGVLSMARNGDPNEDPQNGVMPRAEYCQQRGEPVLRLPGLSQYAATRSALHGLWAGGGWDGCRPKDRAIAYRKQRYGSAEGSDVDSEHSRISGHGGG